MTCKKLFSLFCALAMLLTTPVVHAEDAADFSAFARVPDTLYYKGGVVMRGFVKGADTASRPLDLAYAMTSMPYIVLGQPTSWDVVITGGDGDYLCEAILAYQSDLTQSEFGTPWDVPDWFYVEDGSFDYTFTEPGRYFWEFRVMDENGQFFVFQTRIYETYTEANETQETTVAGKVNSIISELITPEMSDYNRALVLHDWLIYNANYDYSSNPNYDAAGVLLKGTGVCDSYARAYLMLCTAAGLECMYISGTAYSGGRWENHGWNMVKLNGSWYHVDCTWDDPNEGGYENHTYFCLDDETMARDHRWNRPDDLFDNGFLPPEAEGGEYEEDREGTKDYEFTFASIEEYDQKFDQLVADGHRLYETIGLYTGTDPDAMVPAFDAWTIAKVQELANERLITGYTNFVYDNLYSIILVWNSESSHIRIQETNMMISVGSQDAIYPYEYFPNEDVFAWKTSNPSVATVSPHFNSDPTDNIPDGPYAIITGVSTGTATITASTDTDFTDSLTVTVLPAHTPDFALTLADAASGAELDWADIPGVTEYQIIRVADGVETILATTTGTSITLTSKQLPADVQQQVYIVGLRKVGGEVIASYKSDPITYGKLTLTFTSTLPGGLLVIEDEAFAGDTSLTSFDIPDKVTTIGARAFANCTSLTAVRIPASVTSIGSSTFSGCPLKYAEVVRGSYADYWLQEYCPDTQLIY